MLASEETLLLAGEAGVDDGRREFVLTQDARCFERARHAGRIVIGAGSIDLAIHHIGSTRVDVARHDNVAIGMERSALDGDNVHHPGVFRDPAVLAGSHEVALFEHVKASAAVGRDAFELAADPPPGGANSTTARRGV